MDLLNRLDKVAFLHEAVKEYKNAFDFIQALKKKLRTITGGNFLKVTFDSGYAGQGMVFVKYANSQWKTSKEKDLKDSKINFIISVEGFDDAGEIDDQLVVEMYKFFDDNKSLKKIRKKKSSQLGDVYRHIVSYFQENDDEFTLTEEGIGGDTAGGTPVATDSSGGTTSSGNIAAHRKKFGETCEKCGKENCECMNEDSENPFTSVNQLPINKKKAKEVKKKYGTPKV